jgi:hypothetical protein
MRTPLVMTKEEFALFMHPLHTHFVDKVTSINTGGDVSKEALFRAHNNLLTSLEHLYGDYQDYLQDPEKFHRTIRGLKL